MTENVIEVRGLRKDYAGRTAVSDVSFDVRRGETFALLGPNGAGKSTTVEILEGYRHRTGGEVRVLGVDPRHGGIDWKARLGIVLQSTGETGNVSVRELLSEFAGYYPDARDVDEVIDAVGLAEKRKVRVGRLSGGQRRRLDVALGIVGRPELLFLDEPTTGFDPEARRQFWELIGLLADAGTTVLLTTHYLDEAARLADRAAVIADGTIVDIGPIDEIGGAASRTPIVRWTDAAGALNERRTARPGSLVAELVSSGGEPSGLEVVRPSLEDVYLDLIGARSPDPRSAGESGPDAEGSAGNTRDAARSSGDSPAERAEQAAHPGQAGRAAQAGRPWRTARTRGTAS